GRIDKQSCPVRPEKALLPFREQPKENIPNFAVHRHSSIRWLGRDPQRNEQSLLGETDTKYRAGEESSGSSTRMLRRTLMNSSLPRDLMTSRSSKNSDELFSSSRS